MMTIHTRKNWTFIESLKTYFYDKKKYRNNYYLLYFLRHTRTRHSPLWWRCAPASRSGMSTGPTSPSRTRTSFRCSPRCWRCRRRPPAATRRSHWARPGPRRSAPRSPPGLRQPWRWAGPSGYPVCLEEEEKNERGYTTYIIQIL